MVRPFFESLNPVGEISRFRVGLWVKHTDRYGIKWWEWIGKTTAEVWMEKHPDFVARKVGRSFPQF